jgi:hypothetical protein
MSIWLANNAYAARQSELAPAGTEDTDGVRSRKGLHKEWKRIIKIPVRFSHN